MILREKIVVVMPPYNADRTIEKTWRELIAQEIVDLVVVVDDAGRDATVARARMLDKVVVHTHQSDRGYGANQKTSITTCLPTSPLTPPPAVNVPSVDVKTSLFGNGSRVRKSPAPTTTKGVTTRGSR
jgi:hypothetical protein